MVQGVVLEKLCQHCATGLAYIGDQGRGFCALSGWEGSLRRVSSQEGTLSGRVASQRVPSLGG